MRIANLNTTTNFKGYDAAPLKKLYISSKIKKPIVYELKSAADSENIELKCCDCSVIFNQDHRVILENNGEETLLYRRFNGMGGSDPKIDDKFENSKEYSNLRTTSRMYDACQSFFPEGGNFYIYKNSNGEKHMLLGHSMYEGEYDIEKCAKTFKLKPENIHLLEAQNYHLDTYVRPIGYPYVLIDNQQMVKDNVKNHIKTQLDYNPYTYFKEISQNNPAFGDKQIKKSIESSYNTDARFQDENTQKRSLKKNIEILKSLGFIPIEIAGEYGNGVNFLNAIVNKHPDGSISYITNSSECIKPKYKKFEDQFQRDLEEKLKQLKELDPNAPTLDKIYFIKGKKYDNSNDIIRNVKLGAGGVHCMAVEHPDFEAWG